MRKICSGRLYLLLVLLLAVVALIFRALSCSIIVPILRIRFRLGLRHTTIAVFGCNFGRHRSAVRPHLLLEFEELCWAWIDTERLCECALAMSFGVQTRDLYHSFRELDSRMPAHLKCKPYLTSRVTLCVQVLQN